MIANTTRRWFGKVARSEIARFAFFVLLILASRSAIADWNYVPSGSDAIDLSVLVYGNLTEITEDG